MRSMLIFPGKYGQKAISTAHHHIGEYPTSFMKQIKYSEFDNLNDENKCIFVTSQETTHHTFTVATGIFTTGGGKYRFSSTQTNLLYRFHLFLL